VQAGAAAELPGGSKSELGVSKIRELNSYSKTQATLILASRLSTTPENLMNTLPVLMQELVGFFIIEAHVLRTMPDFRSQRDVDELWDEMRKRIVEIMGQGLKGCAEPEVFLESKTNVLLFVQTLEVRSSAY